MIVSHACKLIFLKTEKTAGTAIEAALSELCGPHDVITPFREESEIELRQVFEAEDFGDALPPEERAREERMRAQMEAAKK